VIFPRRRVAKTRHLPEQNFTVLVKNPDSRNQDNKNPDILQVGKNPDSKYPDSKN
jgi:hypothetical protein